jgi:hypothetical protein
MAPSTAITANHTTVTGPKKPPTRLVPRRWIANSTISTTTVSGITKGSKSGVAVFSPSIALNTEIAGVITPSP